MALNIKDQEAHKLAQALAKETGETMTAAVTRALRERLDRVRKLRRSANVLGELIALGKRGTELEQSPFREEDLYDENGLPK